MFNQLNLQEFKLALNDSLNLEGKMLMTTTPKAGIDKTETE